MGWNASIDLVDAFDNEMFVAIATEVVKIRPSKSLQTILHLRQR